MSLWAMSFPKCDEYGDVTDPQCVQSQIRVEAHRIECRHVACREYVVLIVNDAQYAARVKVFISWSGEQSKAIAEFLKGWLSTVLAGAVEPFVSSQDIAKGERGLNVIAKELEEINYGIVVLTPVNHGASWVNFEAGAMAKSLGQGRVSTVLVGVSRTDITGPLSQFQDTVLTDRGDTKKLVDDMAKAAGSKAPPATIDVLFESQWPELESALAAAGDVGDAATQRDSKDILEEVLDVVRGIANNQRLESQRVPPDATWTTNRLWSTLMELPPPPGEPGDSLLDYIAEQRIREHRNARLHRDEARYDKHLADAEVDASDEHRREDGGEP